MEMAVAAEVIYDAVLEKKKEITDRWKSYTENAKKTSEEGRLRLVHEEIYQPWTPQAFTVKKGQVIRYEMTHGPQILDTVYLVQSRPTEEWADTWLTGQLQALTLHEGDHYISNTPFARPLLSIIKDTVDYDTLRKRYGEGAAHSFIFPSGRCTESLWELAYGVVNGYSCNSGLMQTIVENCGEEVARSHKYPPGVFMHFQVLNYDKIPTNMTYYSGRGVLKVGDYVELLAHDDLYCGVSPCPNGDQHDMSSYENFTCYPYKVAIYEGADGPLDTVPDPEMKSMNAVDFVMAGRPGQVTGKVGKTE